MSYFRRPLVAGAFGRRALRPRHGGHVQAPRRPSLLLRPERFWCAYCAWPAEGWDHVEPWSRTHDNSLENLVPCCHQCNVDKRDLPLIVFLALSMIGEVAA